MPLLPSQNVWNRFGTSTYICSWTHKGPYNGASEGSYAHWLEPPQFCCAFLHNRKVLLSGK